MLTTKPPIYDKISSRYDRVIAPFERRFLARWRKETLSRLPSESSILEIGAGTGLNFAHYPKIRCGVASELSFKMLEIARTKEHPKELQFIQSAAEKIPFADNSFDSCFATLVFCSVKSPQEAFAELKRVVKPCGKIVLLEHVRPKGFLLGNIFDVLNFFTVRLFEDHFNRRTTEEAKQAGLEIINVEQKAASIINIIECKVAK
jgi:ubiquinone/menaquinone biosynthesis C-methylase UbiE